MILRFDGIPLGEDREKRYRRYHREISQDSIVEDLLKMLLDSMIETENINLSVYRCLLQTLQFGDTFLLNTEGEGQYQYICPLPQNIQRQESSDGTLIGYFYKSLFHHPSAAPIRYPTRIVTHLKLQINGVSLYHPYGTSLLEDNLLERILCDENVFFSVQRQIKEWSDFLCGSQVSLCNY